MPDSTRELVDAGQVGALLAVLSGIALLLAVVLGVLSRGRPGVLRCALLSGGVVLAYPLWLVYNRIEDHFGLDSVAALLINLGLFVIVGVAAGLLLRRYWPAPESRPSGSYGPAPNREAAGPTAEPGI